MTLFKKEYLKDSSYMTITDVVNQAKSKFETALAEFNKKKEALRTNENKEFDYNRFGYYENGMRYILRDEVFPLRIWLMLIANDY